MSLAQNIFKGGSYLSGAEIVSQACSIVRNIILARFLTKEDFGIAALLGLILTLFEMTGKMALGQQLIQSKHSNDEAYIDSVHYTQLFLSTVSTVLLVSCAWPLAHFVAGSKYFGSLLLLAMIPLINGFNHLEVYRRTKHQDYGPLVLSETIPQILTTLVAWPLTIFLLDYRAVLWLLVGKSLCYTVLTHYFAVRKFRAQYNLQWLKESLRFGWPLLVGGFVQMANFQGDSMVVAARYTLAQLGEYSVALTMAMAPSVALLRISHSIALPLLSSVQSDSVKFANLYTRYVEIVALLSCGATLGMLFCGEQVISFFYGAKYTGIGALACLLTASQGLRIIRGATVGAAMSQGNTMNILIANLWRLSGLILAVAVGWFQGSLGWFALTAFAGELIALAISTRGLATHHGLPLMLTAKPTLMAAFCVITATCFRSVFHTDSSSPINWVYLILSLILSCTFFFLLLPPLRRQAAELASHLNSRLGSPISISRGPTPPPLG